MYRKQLNDVDVFFFLQNDKQQSRASRDNSYA